MNTNLWRGSLKIFSWLKLGIAYCITLFEIHNYINILKLYKKKIPWYSPLFNIMFPNLLMSPFMSPSLSSKISNHFTSTQHGNHSSDQGPESPTWSGPSFLSISVSHMPPWATLTALPCLEYIKYSFSLELFPMLFFCLDHFSSRYLYAFLIDPILICVEISLYQKVFTIKKSIISKIISSFSIL